MATMSGSELEGTPLSAFFDNQIPDRGAINTDIETNRRSELAESIREEYASLINGYGKSNGSALQVTVFPKPRPAGFEKFTITSSRGCPTITIEDSNNELVSLKVMLRSEKHEDFVAKYYDPATLTSIFPEDAIEVELWANGIASVSGLNYRTKAFFIYPERVYKIDSEVGHIRMKEGGIEAVNSHSEDNLPSLGELESLIALVPLLRERYEVLRGETSRVESHQNPVKQLSGPVKRFLGLFQRGRL